MPSDRHVGALPVGRSRSQLVAEVVRALDIVDDDATVVVATSGGPDSTAMAALVDEARPDLDLLLVHVRHGLRDDQPDVDAVTHLAGLLGARMRVEQVDVRTDGRGVEDAARRARHAVLDRVATTERAARILVGHTADDQAETVLLRLARGTGLPGLGAMRPDTGRLLRPLLRLRRADVHAFLAGEGLPSAHDPTNDDPDVRRVRVRQDVLPALERLGGDPVGALARLADLAASDEEILERIADDAIRTHVVAIGACHCVALDGLASVGAATARRIVRHMLTRAGVSDEYGPPAEHVATVLSLHTGAAFDIGEVRVSCGGGWLAVGPARAPEAVSVPVAVPGRHPWELLDADLLAVADEAPPLPFDVELAPPVAPERTVVIPGARDDWYSLRLPRSHGHLHVRTPRAGDRVTTDGGTRKLSDVFVDAGVPRVVRPLLPVVVSNDRVLWVPGLAADRDTLHGGRHDPGATLHLVRRSRSRRRRTTRVA